MSQNCGFYPFFLFDLNLVVAFMIKSLNDEKSVLFVYVHLISFASCRDFDISFSLWMDIRAEIREIIANGSKNFNFM